MYMFIFITIIHISLLMSTVQQPAHKIEVLETKSTQLQQIQMANTGVTSYQGTKKYMLQINYFIIKLNILSRKLSKVQQNEFYITEMTR